MSLARGLLSALVDREGLKMRLMQGNNRKRRIIAFDGA